MSFKAIMHVSGQNIVLDYVDLDLNQSVDARSRPASLTRGGTITVEFDTPSDGDMIADWAANPVKQLDGSITYMNQNQDSVMKTVNFYNAYCIEFMERFDGSMSSSNMKTSIKISPERVNIGGVEHDNNWFVYGTSKGAGAKAVTSSSSIASKEGTEFEKGTVVESKGNNIVASKQSVPTENPAKIRATEIIDKATLEEPAITEAIVNLAKANGGQTEGLDFRVKTVESLARKLETEGVDTPIKDAIRYTITFDKDSLTEGATNVMEGLEKAGFEKIKTKNTFKEGEIYKGVNTAFKTPDGQVFELQFHTPESFDVKQNLTHGLYEELRLIDDPASPRATEIKEELQKISDTVELPKNIDKIR
jgi:hypothetical protein